MNNNFLVYLKKKPKTKIKTKEEHARKKDPNV